MNGPKKGSKEEALAYWNENAPNMLEGIQDLLVDVYNFRKVGVHNNTKVARAIELTDGSRIRLAAYIE